MKVEDQAGSRNQQMNGLPRWRIVSVDSAHVLPVHHRHLKGSDVTSLVNVILLVHCAPCLFCVFPFCFLLLKLQTKNCSVVFFFGWTLPSALRVYCGSSTSLLILIGSHE